MVLKKLFDIEFSEIFLSEIVANEEARKYLKNAEQWLKDKFKGQEVLSSIIHMDEGKPHLHITFSYFNKDIKRWNQRGLKDKNLTATQ